MKKSILSLLFAIVMIPVQGQEIYSRAFGNPKNSAVIFLHGGPGYNSSSFEITTAETLADSGYYVIVYDRRGEGRSTASQAQFNFKETFADLNLVFNQYQIEKATLIGHSFGGIVSTLYAKQYPNKVNAVFLVGAPIALQETFKTIIKSSRKIYEANNDKTNLMYIDMLEKMDSTSAEYYSYAFAHAMQNGFYSPKKKSDEAKAIYSNASKDPNFQYVSKMTIDAPQGFLKNENYTSIDLHADLTSMVKAKFKIYGLYGKEDGLYSIDQVNRLQDIIGVEQMLYLDNCSHSVFIDQQKQFIDFLKSKLK